MKGIMENVVLPKLAAKLNLPPILHRTILTQGIGESNLSELIAEWEDQLPHNMKLAYLLLPEWFVYALQPMVRISNCSLKALDIEVEKLRILAFEYIYGYEDETLESIVGQLLRKGGKTLSTAESCTGGYIAHKITSVPGSSDYYIGSVIAYAYRIKEDFLNIDPKLLNTWSSK